MSIIILQSHKVEVLLRYLQYFCNASAILAPLEPIMLDCLSASHDGYRRQKNPNMKVKFELRVEQVNRWNERLLSRGNFSSSLPVNLAYNNTVLI